MVRASPSATTLGASGAKMPSGIAQRDKAVRLMLLWSRGLLLSLCGVALAGCAGSGVRPLSVEKASHDFELVVETVEKNYLEPVVVEALVAAALEGMYRFTGMAPLSDAELQARLPATALNAEVIDPLARFSLTYDYLTGHIPESPVNIGSAPPQNSEPEANDQTDIGVTLAHDGEWIRIATVAIDSAAELAGLNRGDGIIAIDGQPTDAMSLSWCYQQLSGAVGTIVEVTVHTEQGSVIDVQVVRIKPYLPTIVWLSRPWRGG